MVCSRCMYWGDFEDLPTYSTVKCMFFQAVKGINIAHTALFSLRVSPMSLSWLTTVFCMLQVLFCLIFFFLRIGSPAVSVTICHYSLSVEVDMEHVCRSTMSRACCTRSTCSWCTL